MEISGSAVVSEPRRSFKKSVLQPLMALKKAIERKEWRNPRRRLGKKIVSKEIQLTVRERDGETEETKK